MKRKKIALLGGVLMLATLGIATPALASGTPGTCTAANPATPSGTAPNSGAGTNTNGGACTVEGSATIASVLSFEVGVSSFSFPNGASTDTSTASPQFEMYVYANTPGYYVSEAVTTPFAGTSAPSNILNAADFSAGYDTPPSTCDGTAADNGGASGVPGTTFTDIGGGLSSPIQVVSVPCASSGHNYQNNNPSSGASTGFPTPYDQFSVQGWMFTTADLTGGTTAAPADTYTGDVTMALWS